MLKEHFKITKYIILFGVDNQRLTSLTHSLLLELSNINLQCKMVPRSNKKQALCTFCDATPKYQASPTLNYIETS